MGGNPDPWVGEGFFETFELCGADAFGPLCAELVEDLFTGAKQGVALVGDREAAAAAVPRIDLAGDVASLLEKRDRLGCRLF